MNIISNKNMYVHIILKVYMYLLYEYQYLAVQWIYVHHFGNSTNIISKKNMYIHIISKVYMYLLHEYQYLAVRWI